MTTNMNKLLIAAAGALTLAAFSPAATAGTGSNYSAVKSAIDSNGVGAIQGELERAEYLMCPGCVDLVAPLLEDDRYEVREVAAWWFARRASEAKILSEQSIGQLGTGNSTQVRNAADLLGTFRHPVAVPALQSAYARSGLSPEARISVVRALGTIGVAEAVPTLTQAMSDADPGVRYAALDAWIAIRGQTDAEPAVALVSDSSVMVRRKAAGVVGELREATGRLALEAQLASDPDPAVRRNAAWALGRIGDLASREALDAAASDSSSLVRMTARVARRQLR